MKLTRQMFIDGIEDIDALKIKDLKAFCEEEGFDVNLAARRGKPAILNDIAEMIEESPTDVVMAANEPETITASSESEEPPEMSKIRENGEVIRLASDGKDYGANLLNRTK